MLHPATIPFYLQAFWQEHPDHYVVKDQSQEAIPTFFAQITPLSIKAFSICKPCIDAHLSKQKDELALLSKSGPLRCLELFAGAGGLSTGMEKSGFVSTKWAVEIDSSAALSFQ